MDIFHQIFKIILTRSLNIEKNTDKFDVIRNGIRFEKSLDIFSGFCLQRLENYRREDNPRQKWTGCTLIRND